MKKFIIPVLVIIVFMLQACSGDLKKHQSIAKSAVEIANDYMNNEITYKEANDMLDNLDDKIDSSSYSKEDEDYNDVYHVEFNLAMLNYQIMIDGQGDSENGYESIIEYRDKLKEYY